MDAFGKQRSFVPIAEKEDWPAIRNDNPVLLSAFITPCSSEKQKA